MSVVSETDEVKVEEVKMETKEAPKPKNSFRRFVQGPNEEKPKEVPFGWGPEGVQQTFVDPRSEEQIRNKEVPKPLSDEEKTRIYEEARNQAVLRFHLTRAKALIGHPEGYSLQEIQEMSDLFPMKTVSFDEWWNIQRQRQVEALKAQASK